MNTTKDGFGIKKILNGIKRGLNKMQCALCYEGDECKNDVGKDR